MPTSTTDAVAAEVRAAIARKRMTQADLARETGIGVSTLSRRMAGQSPFTVDELAAISECVGIPVSQLIPAEVA